MSPLAKGVTLEPRNSYLIFGAGIQGIAIAHDLLNARDTGRVTIVDRAAERLEYARKRLPQPRLETEMFDMAGEEDLVALLTGYDCVIGAASYTIHLALTKAALAAGAHYCDLGCQNDVVAQQFALHDHAKDLGLRVMPDCGVAPGAVCVLARHAIDRIPSAERVELRVGGIPQKPEGHLRYALAYSAEGLLSNYVEPVEVLRDGVRKLVPPLEEHEYQSFPEPIGWLEAQLTSGGLSTLARTYEGRIKHLDYKTLRWPGHWDIINVMSKLGLLEQKEPIIVRGTKILPREFTEQLLERVLPRNQPDLIVMRVRALDATGHGVQLDVVDRKNPVTGFSAMQRTTGYATSIVAQMLVSGEIGGTGVLKHEEVVPPERFIAEWRLRNIVVTETAITP